MRRLLAIVLCVCAGVGWPLAGEAAPKMPATVEVYYSPHGGCTEALVHALQAARQTVLVQAYSFTSPQIEQALVDAAKRGVKVQLILDRSNLTQKSSELAEAAATASLHIWIDARHKIAHNKVMILDGEIVITGSFNFTHNAEADNAENLLIIHSKELAASYTANWQEHAAHSEPYDSDATGKVTKPEHTAFRKATAALH